MATLASRENKKTKTWRHWAAIPIRGKSLRGNRIGATGLRASERKSASERVSEREGFQRFLRGFERFSEVLRGFQRFLRGFQRFLRGFQRSSQRPSQRQISSQRLSALLPPIVLPLELSPKSEERELVPESVQGKQADYIQVTEARDL